MRMSCNGCRVLRKGCSDKCTIRPCLQWIRSSDSQANATVFLAKFYGRAGLMNLINSGPENLRPAIFRSLLYEACGRIVNPIYGAVGLLWSGNWQLCQDAVEAVMKGAPITPITSEAATSGRAPPLKAYDIRHVSKGDKSASTNEPRRVKTRGRLRRSPAKPKEANPSPSHMSSMSHQSEAANESMVSVEMAEASLLFGAEQAGSGAKPIEPAGDGEIGLELTLGLEPGSRADQVVPVKKRRFVEPGLADYGACKIELGLDCSA